MLEGRVHDGIGDRSNRFALPGLASPLAESTHGLKRVPDLPRNQLLGNAPLECPFDQVRSPIDLAAGKSVPDEFGLACSERQGTEVFRERVSIEPTENLQRKLDQQDLIG